MRFTRESEGYLMQAEGVSNGKRVQEQPQRFILDDKEHPVAGAPDVVVVSSCPDANTIRTVARSGDRTLGEGSYVVSADGATLTATISGIDAQQRRFETTVLWDRQK